MARQLAAAMLIAVLASVLPGATAPRSAVATQQGGNPPTEPTLNQLRAAVTQAMGRERQAQLLGEEPSEGDPSNGELQYELLERTFDDFWPRLVAALDDCFRAEAALREVTAWLRQSELLGMSSALGDRVDAVVPMLDRIIINCHDEVYRRCVLDDDDPPWVPYLPGLTRQAALVAGDDPYLDRLLKCLAGWSGTITIRESLQGNRSRSVRDAVGSSMGTSTGTSTETGSREVVIERRERQSSGTANGRATSVYSEVTTFAVSGGSSCTTSMVTEVEAVSSGAGQAALVKKTSPDGQLNITFRGPAETGSQQSQGRGSSTCGAGPGPSPSTSPRAAAAFGSIMERLADPYAETISASRTETYQIVPGGRVRARVGADGSVARIPLVPGAPPLEPVESAWVDDTVPSLLPGQEGTYPTVTVTTTWNLVFGVGSGP